MTPQSRLSALVLSLADINTSTDIIGNSPETQVNVAGAGMSVYLIDDCESLSQNKTSIQSDGELWTVSENLRRCKLELTYRIVAGSGLLFIGDNKGFHS